MAAIPTIAHAPATLATSALCQINNTKLYILIPTLSIR